MKYFFTVLFVFSSFASLAHAQAIGQPCPNFTCDGDAVCKAGTCQANAAACTPPCSGNTPICDTSSGTPTCISQQQYGDQSIPGTTPSGTGAPTTPSNSGASGGLTNPLGTTSLSQLLSTILGFVVKLGTVVVILMLVYIGFLFATSSVNPEHKEQAKEYLFWTLVGALILLGAQLIASGIQATVGAISGSTGSNTGTTGSFLGP